MVNPSKWVNLKSNFLKFHHRNQAISGIEKARKMAYFRAFLALLSCRLSLAELRSATSGFEAVLLTFFHSRVTSQVSSFFQNWSVLSVCLQQGTSDTVTDSSSLSGKSTTVNVYQNVKFFCIVCCCQWLTNNNFQSLQSEVLVDVSFIDCDLTSSWYQVYSGDRFFSSSCSVEFCSSQCYLPPIKMLKLPVSELHVRALHQRIHEVS